MLDYDATYEIKLTIDKTFDISEAVRRYENSRAGLCVCVGGGGGLIALLCE